MRIYPINLLRSNPPTVLGRNHKMAAKLEDVQALAAYKCHNMALLVPFIKLVPQAQAPVKAHACDAGFDLHTLDDIELSHASPTALAKTGIAIAIPPGYYGRVASRSGLSVKNNIEVGAGVIDSGYRGEIMVKLHLFHAKPEDATITLEKGSRVAQLIITPCPLSSVVHVDRLDNTDRADGAFGSTGK